MSFLTEAFDDTISIDGKEYEVNMAFDNILLLFEMFEDDSITEQEKWLIALQMLIPRFKEIIFDSFEDMITLYKFILQKFLGFNGNQEDKEKVCDFKKDAELIYASFFSAYKMDLIEQRGKLHWKKFNALLTHLDDDTAFKKVVGYRTMEIPKPNKHNQEQIKQIRKLKERYSLDDRTADEKVSDAFTSVGHALKGVAKKAGE